MKDKKTYNSLDEIGFIGTQTKGNRRNVEKDIHDTVQYIKSKKADNTLLKFKKKSAGVFTSKVSK